MLEVLTKGFKNAHERLSGVRELTEQNVDEALLDVRMSLLEADVDFQVVKDFLGRVKERGLGERGRPLGRAGPAPQLRVVEAGDAADGVARFDGPAQQVEPRHVRLAIAPGSALGAQGLDGRVAPLPGAKHVGGQARQAAHRPHGVGRLVQGLLRHPRRIVDVFSESRNDLDRT